MNMQSAIDIIGWAGVIAYVVAYALLSMGWMKADHINYHILNALGGICLAIISYDKADTPNFFVNLVWMVIALISITKLVSLKVKKKAP